MTDLPWTAELAEASPDTASTVASVATIKGLGGFDAIVLDAYLQGATGGTLDIYVQRLAPDGTNWLDYAHFPQLADGAAAQWYTAELQPALGINAVGSGTSPSLAANTILGGHPGSEIRLVFVAGTGTSAGAAQRLFVSGHRIAGQKHSRG